MNGKMKCAMAALLAAALAACDQTPGTASKATCADLAAVRLSLPGSIVTAEDINASEAQPWASPTGFGGSAKMTVPFCRVAGVLKPTPESEIRFEVWMPPAGSWSGRFYGTAVGGSMGALQYASLVEPLSRGYAAMTHDNGHVSRNTYEQDWAFDTATRTVRKEKVIDFASRAQHVATVAAKDMIKAYYGDGPRHSYYLGCSQGGHHGMMEAERYPDDYDGIVAGAHGGDWSGMMASEAWAAYHVTINDRAGAIAPDVLATVEKAAIASCDAGDGLVDGQIEDPRACAFDPAVLQCGKPGVAAGQCLTPAQVATSRLIYQGPRTSRGEQLAPGYLPGSESAWSWNAKMELKAGSYYDFFRLVMKQNPDWDFTTFDWDRDITEGRKTWSGIYDALNPDLSAFQGRGGKLIIYHGWSDALITPHLSVNAYERINAAMGQDKTASFARLFMIPGMYHCDGGPIGGTRASQEKAWLTAIERWVEQGVAPDATSPENTVIGAGKIADLPRTRPYCPYPKLARYKGEGDINAAANFTCE